MADHFSPLWRQHGPRIVAGVLALLIAIEIAQGARILRAHAPPAVPIKTQASIPGAPQIHVSAIIAAHLFGVAAAPGAIDPRGEPPDSRANWGLTATIATEDPRHGYAIISADEHPPALYVAGAAVAPDVSLAEVFTNRVVLLRSGVAETLWMTKKSQHFTKARVGVAMAKEDEESRRYGNSIKLTHGVNDPAAPVAPYPTPVIQRLHVMPVVMDYHLMGYTVTPKIASAVKGLPDQSTVTHINGVLLDGGATTQRMFESLTYAGSATFTVRDGDGERDVVVDLSGLPAAVSAKLH